MDTCIHLSIHQSFRPSVRPSTLTLFFLRFLSQPPRHLHFVFAPFDDIFLLPPLLVIRNYQDVELSPWECWANNTMLPLGRLARRRRSWVVIHPALISLFLLVHWRRGARPNSCNTLSCGSVIFHQIGIYLSLFILFGKARPWQLFANC